MNLRSSGSLLLVSVSIALGGCGHAFGPEKFETTSVSGRILLDGAPMPGLRGFVEAVPVAGTIGRMRSAPIAPDGSFRFEGIAVGSVAMKLAGPSPTLSNGDAGLSSYLFNLYRSFLIRRTIPPGGGAPLEIDLRTEASEFRRRYLPRE